MKHGELKMDLLQVRKANGEIAVAELSLAQWGAGGWVDVAAMKPSWKNPNPTGYEVKGTRSDFLSDVRGGKYRRYLDYFRRFYFATPAGMVKKDEVPEECGLIVRGDNGWHGVKAPRALRVEDEARHQLVMAMLLRMKQAPWRTREDSPEMRAARVLRYREHEDVRRVIDGEVKRQLEHAEDQRREYERARKKVARALGYDPDECGKRRLKGLVDELLARESTGQQVKDEVAKVLESYTMTKVESGVAELRERLQELAGVGAMPDGPTV